MTEPTRLLELDPGDLRARLLRSAVPDAPAEGAHERAGIALGLVPLAASAAPVAHSVSKSLVAMIAKWVGIGALAGVVTSGIASRAIDSMTHEKPIAAKASPAPIGEPPALAVRQSEPNAPALVEQPSMPAPIAVPPHASALAPPSPSSSAVKPADTLADELSRLDRAREALASGNAAGAIAALDRYRADYPRARLGDESTALRVEALLAQGNRGEAVALADRFLNEHPRSPLSQRVRTLVAR